MNQELLVSVVGGGAPTPAARDLALRTGRILAKRGAVVVTGGLGGVMEAASRGAAEEGGLTVGFLPGTSPETANPWVRLAIPTGLGEARNALVATSGRGVIAIGGEVGTLSEIALALRRELPVISLDSWTLDEGRLEPHRRFLRAKDPEQAVDLLFDAIRESDRRNAP